jgi:flagellar hook protein FlgE
MTSLNGILDNGVMGMIAQSNAMGSVSDNIANIDTVGFKRSNTVFQTLLGERDGTQGPNDATKTPGTPSSQNGVTSFTQQLVTAPGSIQTTGNNLDLALPGSGMFVFQSIPPAGSTGTTTTSGPVYGRAGNLQEVVPTTAAGTAGLSVNGVPLVANAAYLANQNGQLLLGVPVTPGTTTTAPTSASGLVPIQVSNGAPFPGQPTSSATLLAVVPAVGATSASTPIDYVDSTGTKQALTLTWSNPVRTPGAGVSWTLTATDAKGNVVGSPSQFSFDSQGNATTTSVPITANGASFTIDTTGVQMLGAAQGNSTGGQALAVNTSYNQNGLPSGTFDGVQINSDGTVVGQYSSGATQVLYQIPLAQFASPDNLQVLAGNVYAPTQSSGSATYALPGQGASTIDVGALEESNVDLGAAFTTMILTQQAYSSSAQVVQAANQMSVTSENLIT